MYIDPVFIPREQRKRIQPIDTTNTQDNKDKTNEQNRQRQQRKRMDGRYVQFIENEQLARTYSTIVVRCGYCLVVIANLLYR